MSSHSHAGVTSLAWGEMSLENPQAFAASGTAPAAGNPEALRSEAASCAHTASTGLPRLISGLPSEGNAAPAREPNDPPAFMQAPLLIQLRQAGLLYVQRQSARNQYALGVLGASIPAIVAELALNVPVLSDGITGFFLRWTIRLLASACLFGGWRFTRKPLMKWWGWGVVTGLVLAILILVFLKAHFGLTTY